ncbi:Ig-like domain-containing protein [Variimorphobacter saccharofermentans]|nr:Ig-like domain-containing protein [Variimorphobacter saccharofermentans]
MKAIKKVIMVIILAAAMLAPVSVPFMDNYAIAEAATVKISNKKLSLKVGETKALKITGTTKKVTWTSSKKSVATVSSKGKVTAKSAGTATITATVNKKKYTCKVTVTKKLGPNERELGNLTITIPEGWTYEFNPIMLNPSMADLVQSQILTPPNASYGNDIQIYAEYTGKKAPAYADIKGDIARYYTEEELAFSSDIKITNLNVSDFTTNHGTAFRAAYTLTVDGTAYNMVVYEFYIDNYYLKFTVSDTENLNMDATAVTVINSIK